VLGFTFFTLELVWYRMLAPILGGTTFTFGMILCVALFGIGVGSAAYHLVFRWVRPSWSVLAVTCAAEAVLAAFPLALGDRLALFAGRWFVESRTFFQLEMGWILVMSVVVLPVALVSGLQFPLLVALLGRGRMAVSRQLGMTYAWNTVGAIAGSLVGGFGALPLLTAPGAWRAVALLLVGLSIVLLLRSWRSAGRSAAVVAALLLVAVFCVAQEGPTAVWRHSSIGAGRALVPPANDLNGTQFWVNEQRRKLLWEAEGIESSIGITATDGISFVVNGKNDGNATGDVGTQIGMAIIGATLHPDPKTGLVIGLGTGESAGWLASLREMERVDVLELEPAIDEMARRSAILNRDALNHPKVRRIYNDGREHVLTTTEKYDVVLSEPSNPYRAGVSSLYTQEFYRAVRARMTPDGVFVQWLQAYEVDPYTVNSVLATARSVFDYVELWQTLPGDLQLVCSQAPIKYSEAELRARVAEPVMEEALRLAWSVDGLEGFLSRFAGNQAFVNRVVSPGMYPANTDDRNFLEYGFAKTVGLITGFSGASVRDAAVEFGEHRPPLVGDTIVWDLVERRRVEFNWQNGGNLAAHKTYTPAQRALIEGYNEFYNQKFPEALAKWAAVPEGKLSDIDRLVQSAAHAEVGDAKCLELIAPVAAEYPAEAAAVRATYYWSQKDATRATEQVMLLVDSMASNPWAISDLVRLTFKQASTIVGQDPAAERQLFEKLSKPFAAERFEHQRPLLRLLIAEKLGQAEVIEVLEELEPNPPWLEDSLQLRAETYKAAKHPLAEQAQRDWEAFQENAK
jgi:spermidine synthase